MEKGEEIDHQIDDVVYGKCFILIKFPDADSASPEIFFQNVNAFQVMASASVLEVHGKNGFVQMLNAKADEQQRVAVAKPEILRPG